MDRTRNVEEFGSERLTLVVNQVVEGINSVLSDTLMDDCLADGYFVDVISGSDNVDRSTCLISDEKPARIIFNDAQFESLVVDFSTGAGVTNEDVARVYVGAGVAMKSLERSISPKDYLKVDRIYTIMAGINDICTAVSCSADFGDKDQKDQLFSLMLSDEKTRCRINNLRFGVGLLFESEKARGNEEFVNRVSQAIRNRMTETLTRKNSYIAFLEGQEYDKTQAEALFAEHITELELAICFPMTDKEIRNIFNVSSMNMQNHDHVSTVGIELSDLSDGFCEE